MKNTLMKCASYSAGFWGSWVNSSGELILNLHALFPSCKGLCMKIPVVINQSAAVRSHQHFR